MNKNQAKNLCCVRTKQHRFFAKKT